MSVRASWRRQHASWCWTTPYFALDAAQALRALAEVHAAVSAWRQLALGPQVGLKAADLEDFAPAFEHAQMDEAAALLGER